MSNFDHNKLLGNLSPNDRKSLREQSDIQGLRRFALHGGAIALCGTLIMMDAPFWPAIMLVQGILINFLFTTLHETSHRTPFKTNFLNVWVGRICGFLVFLGPEWFRYFHFTHHRFTNDPDKDPELASPRPGTTLQYLKYLSGIPDWIDRAKTLTRNAIHFNQDDFVPQREKSRVMQEARVQLSLYAGIAVLSLLFLTPLVLFVWLIPIVLGGPFLRACLLAEHARCPHAASMLENTRTTFTNKLVRFIAWNMPYHVEHHAYPAVPFHKLPEFHKYVRDHIRHQENGYLRFNHAYVRDSISGNLAGDLTGEMAHNGKTTTR